MLVATRVGKAGVISLAHVITESVSNCIQHGGP